MQKIILIIDLSDYAYYTPAKIGNIFMNRSAIDEDASSEVLRIFQIEASNWTFGEWNDHNKKKRLRLKTRGMDHFIVKK